jgi:hypothetical protein
MVADAVIAVLLKVIGIFSSARARVCTAWKVCESKIGFCCASCGLGIDLIVYISVQVWL